MKIHGKWLPDITLITRSLVTYSPIHQPRFFIMSNCVWWLIFSNRYLCVRLLLLLLLFSKVILNNLIFSIRAGPEPDFGLDRLMQGSNCTSLKLKARPGLDTVLLSLWIDYVNPYSLLKKWLINEKREKSALLYNNHSNLYIAISYFYLIINCLIMIKLSIKF